LTSCKLDVDVFSEEWKAGGHSFEDADECRSV
jgi:hypothetical protein